jgi:hypothetical protein
MRGENGHIVDTTRHSFSVDSLKGIDEAIVRPRYASDELGRMSAQRIKGRQ